MERMSKLVPYSLGQAVANKEPGSKMLMVLPIEDFPAVDGEVTSEITKVETKGVDPDGKAYTTASNASTGLSAEWLPFGTNRLTAPDIRRKERVQLYRFADEDKYYWTELGLDDHLRKLETVIYVYNADPDTSSTNAIDINKCYFIEMSPRTKQVTFQTSKANGEPFRYTTQFNTATGHFGLADDAGNWLELDSKNTEIRFKNRDNSYIELTKKIISLYAPDKMNLTAVNEMNLSTKVLNVTVGQVTNWKSPTINIEGNIFHKGNTVQKGSLQNDSITTTTMKGGSVTGGDVHATTLEAESSRAKTFYADNYQNLP